MITKIEAVRIDGSYAYNLYGHTSGFPINFSNGQYTLTVNGMIDSGNQFIFQYEYSDSTYSNITFEITDDFVKRTMTSNNLKSIDKLIVRYNSNPHVLIKNIQLEEGSIATAYEPYYITSDTTVVQNSNHTLKAIWQAN